MTFIWHKDGTVSLRLSCEQFGLMQYGLDTGSETLTSRAIFHKSMKHTCAREAGATAKAVAAVSDLIEAVKQDNLRRVKP